MSQVLNQLLSTRVDWVTTAESPYTFQALTDGRVVKLRLNDFPDEPFCTVMIDGTETDLEDIPDCWSLPRQRGE